jgi:hypothetical protein
MNVFLVEAEYLVTRRVTVQITAPDEVGAQAVVERLIAKECEASKCWLEQEAGSAVSFVENRGTMEPQQFGVCAAN